MDDKYENLNPADDIFYHSELDHHSPDYDPEGYADRQVEPDYPDNQMKKTNFMDDLVNDTMCGLQKLTIRPIKHIKVEVVKSEYPLGTTDGVDYTICPQA